MKATSYLIMWLTLFLVVVLAMVLGLVILLLAEFYCSPLLRRHRRRRQLTTPNTNTATAADTTGNNSTTHSPSALDSHTDPLTDIEKQLLESPENQETGGTQRQDIVDMQNGCLSDSVNGSSLIYISNPIYGDGNGTPFETPGSSPSRLETEDSSDDEREEVLSKVVVTPPLTPMKKLPAEACSVCMKDVRSLGTSESDTNSNNGVSSSCSLTDPCTSPSL
ncbi:hypothetical protein L1987_50086 [Smallanthus sonchifolius]|uniref:Uncharacterized protein n=1 Tax=Smallanthus sonchifolius TaxID=185202 RepID=A0ACB9FWH8_9ASTR|nr:hypothetical protein L1987_50086 [Smallanthus sonchifolius]